MKEFFEAWKQVDRNRLAALLSIVPGAGHLYKHHYATGIGILAGNLLVAFIAVLLALATAGFSFLLIPLVWWAGVAASAYGIEDRHGQHHWLHPWTPIQPAPATPPTPRESSPHE